MDLYLIRHAEAGERDLSQWPNDDDRPVSAEGRTRQIACARAMKKLGLAFDELITSPLVRARETAEIIGELTGFGGEILVAATLGHECGAEAVVGLLAKHPPRSTVALVGHEPAFSAVAAALIGGPAGRIRLRKSGVVGIRFEGAAAIGAGTLEFVLKPGMMRKIGK